MTPAQFRLMALVGYFGLWCLLPAWYGWLAPSPTFSLPVVLGFLLTPMLFPLPGLLTGKRYTYAWSSLLSLLYFAHGIGEAYSWPSERMYGIAEIVLSLLWFAGAIGYVRRSKGDAAQQVRNEE